MKVSELIERLKEMPENANCEIWYRSKMNSKLMSGKKLSYVLLYYEDKSVVVLE